MTKTAGSHEMEMDMEKDSKATESQQFVKKVEGDQMKEKGKRAPVVMTAVPSSVNSISSSSAHPKVMIMPPVSLMIAMPHPSGR